MATGLDWAWGRPSEASLDAAGITFACRYLSRSDSSKCITGAEAAWHLHAGRDVVLVYEDQAGAVRRGYAGGVTDAKAADAQARAAGLAGCPLYFACDYDAPASDQPLVNAYLDGAASVIGRARTGLYGGYWPLSRARAAGRARYFWGTRAWSGGNWASAGWKPHIMQGPGVTIGGVSCDWDTANYGDFGQYQGGNVADPVLRQGDSGPAVAVMQRRLDLWGAGLLADGVFGPGTLTALEAFQRARGLTADGICGAATWAELGKQPPGDGQYHGEYETGGMFPLDDLAAKLGWSTNALLRMTAVHYQSFGDDLGAWLSAVLAGGRHDVPVPAGVKLWMD
jgi:hypothetical protein